MLGHSRNVNQPRTVLASALLLSAVLSLASTAMAFGDWMEPDKEFLRIKGFSTETGNVMDDYINRMHGLPIQQYPTKRRMLWYNLTHNQVPASTKPFGSYTFDNNPMPTRADLDAKKAPSRNYYRNGY